MITIRRNLLDDIPAAKQVIMTVGYGIFGWAGSLEDSIRHFEESDEFNDMDDVQTHYFDQNGEFLAVLDDDQLIGMGAIRKIDPSTAEIKRFWLLEQYQGQGIGFQLIKRLFDFAQNQDFKNVRLQTNPQQIRAIAFYKRVGFSEISCYNDQKEEVSMEMAIPETKEGKSSSIFEPKGQ